MAFLTASAFAQSGSGVISGSIKDPTGASVPGVAVAIINHDTGVTANTTSNQDGIYRVGSPAPGSYRVEVEARGFQKVARGPLGLAVGQVIAVDVTLELGQASDTVVVTEARQSPIRRLPTWAKWLAGK